MTGFSTRPLLPTATASPLNATGPGRGAAERSVTHGGVIEPD
jgi:hypothetical protein